MSTLKLTGSSSGSTSLQAPASGSDRVITFPDTAGTAALTSDIIGKANNPSFRVSRVTSHQDISNNTVTLIDFNQEDHDSDNAWNTSTHRFTPQVAGWYQISTQVTFNTGTEQHIMQAGIYKNATEIHWHQVHTGGQAIDHCCQLTTQVLCNGSSDYIDIRVYQNSGHTRGAQHRSGKVTFCEGFLVRAT